MVNWFAKNSISDRRDTAKFASARRTHAGGKMGRWLDEVN